MCRHELRSSLQIFPVKKVGRVFIQSTHVRNLNVYGVVGLSFHFLAILPTTMRTGFSRKKNGQKIFIARYLEKNERQEKKPTQSDDPLTSQILQSTVY